MRFYERIPRGNLGYGSVRSKTAIRFGEDAGQASLAEKESACEHRLQIVSESKIDCLKCGAEWKDMGIG
jgi:hypothetical protein